MVKEQEHNVRCRPVKFIKEIKYFPVFNNLCGYSNIEIFSVGAEERSGTINDTKIHRERHI